MARYTLFEMNGDGPAGRGLARTEAFIRLMALTETPYEFDRKDDERRLRLDPGNVLEVEFRTTERQDMKARDILMQQVFDYGWQGYAVVTDERFLREQARLSELQAAFE